MSRVALRAQADRSIAARLRQHEREAIEAALRGAGGDGLSGMAVANDTESLNSSVEGAIEASGGAIVSGDAAVGGYNQISI